MTTTSRIGNRSILVIDDNTAIHEDFRKILADSAGASALSEARTALAYVDGDVGLLREMAETFLVDYPLRLAEIQQAIATGDSRALRRAAHSLKGGVGCFAAKPTYDAALRLEMMGHGDDLSQARDAYATLEAELSRLVDCLARMEK